MITASVTGIERVQANLAQMGRDADEAARQVAVQGSLLVYRALQAHLRGPKGTDPFWGPTSPPGAFLARRSGQTAQKISPGGTAATFRTPGGRWTASVGSPDPHVLLHETGGTISGSPMLKIPTAAALRANGTSKYPGVSARDIPGTFIWRGKGGSGFGDRAWIAFRAPGDSKITLLYLLKRSVTMRPRRIFSTTRSEVEPGIAAIGKASIEIATRKANT